jgi:SAM-dependent methyltransferase
MLMHRDEYAVMFQVEDNYWWYHGLRALLLELLARYTPARATILDAGCGTGANLKLLQEHGYAVGIDISEEAIAFCRARGIPDDRAFMASLTDLPFPDDLFDLAVSFDVICNIPDDVAAFAQIARVLKPGGRFITQLPAYQWLWSTHDVAVGHQRRYTAGELRDKIAQAGLEVERMTHTNALFLPFVIAERLARRRALHNGNAIQSDLTTPLPRWLNTLAGSLAVAEMRAVARVSLPVGLSVLVVAKKR